MWATDLGFWKWIILVLQLLSSQVVSAVGPYSILLDWMCYHRTHSWFFVFWTRILYRGVQGFRNDCPCGVWCRRLTSAICLVSTSQIVLNFNPVAVYSFFSMDVVLALSPLRMPAVSYWACCYFTPIAPFGWHYTEQAVSIQFWGWVDFV